MPSAPLELPDNFDPLRHMPCRQVDGRPYHTMVLAAQLAAALAANDHPDDWSRLAAVVEALLDCQEHHGSHRGNFRWEWEDEGVEDLNAVEFALFYLIPIAGRQRLPSPLQQNLLNGIRAGLNAITRLDVGLDYTNIVLKDIANSCLGGELLDDIALTQRGRDKFGHWITHLDQSGLPTEYNSPNYAAVAFRVLNQLATLSTDDPTCIRARTILARLGLSAALHLHPATRRWAGPFSRSYRPAMLAQTPAEMDEFDSWIQNGVLPAWLAPLAHRHPLPFQVDEGAGGPVHLSTYHGDSFSLGVASRQLEAQDIIFIALQSNVCIAHFQRPDTPRPGVLFTRYLLDDKWIGSFRTTPSREADQLLPEEGRFWGVQNGGRAIGLYAPRQLNGFNRCASAKAVVAWTQREHVDEIWIGDTKIDALPAQVPPGEVVVIASGGVYSAVLPLSLTDLGGAEIRLADIDGFLVLEMYNYRGPAKTFWELAHPSSFYQGQPQCGFYLEMAQRTAWSNAAEFAAAVKSGTLCDEASPPFTYTPGAQRPWSVEYSRDGQTLGIEADLMDWRLLRRWTDAGDLAYPRLESPLARQSPDGHVQIGAASFRCDTGPAWLCASPDGDCWVAAYHGQEPTSACLQIPQGRVEIESMRTGTVRWQQGKISIEAVDLGAWRYLPTDPSQQLPDAK
jgi:hypothetical protein